MIRSTKIFYLTICAFGFGLATNLQVANLSTILQFSGFQSHLITYLWLIPPITGMILQPVIGIISDNLNTRYGRRKPLFLVSTILGVVSLVGLPFAKNTFLIIFLVILLDIGANGNAQLSRALILDCTDKKDKDKALSWSSAFAGVGAMFAGVLPWILVTLCHLVSPQDSNGQLPHSIIYTFIIGAFCYLFSSCITLIMIKETNTKSTDHVLNSKMQWASLKVFFKDSFQELPRSFWQLSYIMFFAWIPVFAIWNYLTIDFAQNIFKMPIEVTDNIELAKPYLSQANIWTSTLFGLLQAASMLFSFVIPILIPYISVNNIFALGLGIGGLSIIAIALSTSQLLITCLIVTYGVFWATLMICPYAIFSNMIPKKNIAFFMGIFNIAITLPQILTGLVLGILYKYVFHNNANQVIFWSGICLLISMVFSLKSHFKMNPVLLKKTAV